MDLARVELVPDRVDAQGQAIPVQPGPHVALCRCGHSAKKPFCDGAHKTAGFQG